MTCIQRLAQQCRTHAERNGRKFAAWVDRKKQRERRCCVDVIPQVSAVPLRIAGIQARGARAGSGAGCDAEPSKHGS